jgi:hypothetical protein
MPPRSEQPVSALRSDRKKPARGKVQKRTPCQCVPRASPSPSSGSRAGAGAGSRSSPPEERRLSRLRVFTGRRSRQRSNVADSRHVRGFTMACGVAAERLRGSPTCAWFSDLGSIRRLGNAVARLSHARVGPPWRYSWRAFWAVALLRACVGSPDRATKFEESTSSTTTASLRLSRPLGMRLGPILRPIAGWMPPPRAMRRGRCPKER